MIGKSAAIPIWEVDFDPALTINASGKGYNMWVLILIAARLECGLCDTSAFRVPLGTVGRDLANSLNNTLKPRSFIGCASPQFGGQQLLCEIHKFLLACSCVATFRDKCAPVVVTVLSTLTVWVKVHTQI